MPFEKIATVTGTAVYLPGDDIDTDRIIPARYLRCVTFDGLGEHAFRDERYGADGSLLEHPLNRPGAGAARILLSGRNFGCGSSREHAPQSLKRAGFDAVVAESFAEIFFGNATTLGMMCVTADAGAIEVMGSEVERNPGSELSIYLVSRTINIEGVDSVPIGIPNATREALLTGQWDPLGQLLDASDRVASVAATLPYAKWSG